MVSDAEVEKAGRIVMVGLKMLTEAVGEGSELACGTLVKLSLALQRQCERLAKQMGN